MIPTLFVALNPTLRVDTDAVSNLDFHDWRVNEYDWEQDEFNGYLDLTAPVSKTVETGRGDCEDFSMVAASWGCLNEYETSIALLGHYWHGIPVLTHVVAYVDGHIYDDGERILGDIDYFVEYEDDYDWGKEIPVNC